jgi:hypothetical protein
MCTTTKHSEELPRFASPIGSDNKQEVTGFCREASIDLHVLISVDGGESRQKKIAIFRAPNRSLEDQMRPSGTESER